LLTVLQSLIRWLKLWPTSSN